MENTELLDSIKDILLKKFEPILIIKMMRMPTIEELEGFRLYLRKEFGYNSIIFPGEMETDVKLLSVLDFEKTTLDKIQNQMNDLISSLKSELDLPKL